jgi:hypothetical protein
LVQKISTFFVGLDAGITDGTSLNNYTYQWTKDNVNLTTETKPFECKCNRIYTVKVSSPLAAAEYERLKLQLQK